MKEIKLLKCVRSVNHGYIQARVIYYVQTSSQLSAHRVSELEKVISAMKKVMERLQEENESLKKSTAAKVTIIINWYTHLPSSMCNLTDCPIVRLVCSNHNDTR